MAGTEIKAHRIDELIALATSALGAGDCIRAENTGAEAMRSAHQLADYERMSASIKVLQGARASRLDDAISAKNMHRLSSYEQLDPLLSGETDLETGCYLIEPMLVAADGRELRDRALALGVSVFVMVREPKTQLGVWPVVMVGPETVRTMIDPPKRLSPSWFKQASDALGETAVATLGEIDSAPIQIDRLVALLETVVDSQALHESLLNALDGALRGISASAAGNVTE